MSSVLIPVELQSPGQVLASLGLLEATEFLLGGAKGGFSWSGANAWFELTVDGPSNPLEEILKFLSDVRLAQLAPPDFSFKKEKTDETSLVRTNIYPAPKADKMALPVRLSADAGPRVSLSHWADGSGRDVFKGYAGNRSAYSIAEVMLNGKKTYAGIKQLWRERREEMLKDPFGVTTPMGGSFNFDPRGAWTALNVGYSLNDQKHSVLASPFVEMMAAWGLEHTRLPEISNRIYQYQVWRDTLHPTLARLVLSGGLPHLKTRKFQFEFALSGKNKIATYAKEIK